MVFAPKRKDNELVYKPCSIYIYIYVIYIYIRINYIICVHIYIYIYTQYTHTVYDNIYIYIPSCIQREQDINKFGKIQSFITCLHKNDVWQIWGGLMLKGKLCMCTGMTYDITFKRGIAIWEGPIAYLMSSLTCFRCRR